MSIAAIWKSNCRANYVWIARIILTDSAGFQSFLTACKYNTSLSRCQSLQLSILNLEKLDDRLLPLKAISVLKADGKYWSSQETSLCNSSKKNVFWMMQSQALSSVTDFCHSSPDSILCVMVNNNMTHCIITYLAHFSEASHMVQSAALQLLFPLWAWTHICVNCMGTQQLH